MSVFTTRPNYKSFLTYPITLIAFLNHHHLPPLISRSLNILIHTLSLCRMSVSVRQMCVCVCVCRRMKCVYESVCVIVGLSVCVRDVVGWYTTNTTHSYTHTHTHNLSPFHQLHLFGHTLLLSDTRIILSSHATCNHLTTIQTDHRYVIHDMSEQNR